MTNAITQTALSTIASCEGIPPERVTLETQFQEIAVDSLAAIEILFTREQRLEIKIPDDQNHTIRHVCEMVEGIEKTRCGPNASEGVACAGWP